MRKYYNAKRPCWTHDWFALTSMLDVLTNAPNGWTWSYKMITPTYGKEYTIQSDAKHISLLLHGSKDVSENLLYHNTKTEQGCFLTFKSWTVLSTKNMTSIKYVFLQNFGLHNYRQSKYCIWQQLYHFYSRIFCHNSAEIGKSTEHVRRIFNW